MIPSLAFPLTKPGETKRWYCNFQLCAGASFSSKQSFCRHTVLKHASDLPGGGFFLMPESNFFSQAGFKCVNCECQFDRIERLKIHQSLNVGCRDSAFDIVVRRPSVTPENDENNEKKAKTLRQENKLCVGSSSTGAAASFTPGT